MLGTGSDSGCFAIVGRVKNITAALQLLPPARCIVVASGAASVASAIAQPPRPHPAITVHDLQALELRGVCHGAADGDACVAALQMLLLGDCSAAVGSLDRCSAAQVVSLLQNGDV